MARALSPPLLRRSRSADGAGRYAGALRLPPGVTARRLSDPAAREAVVGWLLRSPDHTLYHLPPFVDFLREQNGVADVLLLARDGNPLFALPIEVWGAAGLDSGYSGVVLPPTAREATLRRSVGALAELFAANRRTPFRICQSAQAQAYEDPARLTLLQCLLEGEGIELEQVYVRLRTLDDLPAAQDIPLVAGGIAGGSTLDREWLAGEALGAYDHSTRKKIRNALAAGLTVECFWTGDPATRAHAYERFQPVHEESWARTGLLPKAPGVWSRMSEAVAAGGGRDLVVLAFGGDGEPLAGIVCHAYRRRAIYWSGCTTARGLAQQANPLCMHAAIVACRCQGVRVFELGRFRAAERSSKERSVTRYKSNFGGELLRVVSLRSSPSLSGRVRAARANAVFAVRRRVSLELARGRQRAS